MSPASVLQRSLLAVALLIVGCDREAHSQQPPSPQSVDAPLAQGAGALERIEGEIGSSRRTAITRAVEAASPAVVSVNVIEVRNVRVRDPFADFDALFGRRARPDRVYQQQVQAVGSGFIISPDGYIVTNDHVAGNATKITIAFADGVQLPATLIGSDPETDIALLKVEPEGGPLPFLAFEENGEPVVGEWAIALGNPFGLFEAADPSVTVGVVSAVGRDFPAQGGRTFRDMIQTDAAINSGNSGGPLVDALGRVIGMNTFIYSRSGGSVGLGFAVPSWRIQRVVAELQANGEVNRDFYTGFDVRPVTPRIARALGMSEARGLIVASVEDRSPAANAGLQPYDIIVRIQDEPVPDVSNVRGYVRDQLIDNRIGDTIRLGVVRDGEALDVNLTLQSAG